MTQTDLQAIFREFILQQFPASRGPDVDLGGSLLTQGIVDSLGILEIVTFIERQFEVTLSDDDLVADHFETIPALAKLVADRLSTERLCKV